MCEEHGIFSFTDREMDEIYKVIGSSLEFSS